MLPKGVSLSRQLRLHLGSPRARAGRSCPAAAPQLRLRARQSTGSTRARAMAGEVTAAQVGL
jgi:hypothetical protein